jgi:hypothetical protein
MTQLFLDEENPRRRGFWRGPKLFFALIASLVLGGSTLAANFSINSNSGQGIEFGQGVFRVSACDGFISIALYPTPATYNGLSRVQTVELLGLNPEKCTGKLLRFKFYGSSGNLLDMYRGTIESTPGSNTSTTTVGSATTLTVYDSATAWNQNTTTYSNYAAKALTLINQAGFNVGYSDDYLSITYNKKTGGYKINLFEPLCLMSEVYDISVESAPLGGS